MRKALAEYVKRLEIMQRSIVSSERLAGLLRESNLDVSSISLEETSDFYEEAKEYEWRRLLRRKHAD